jgi:tryptophanase
MADTLIAVKSRAKDIKHGYRITWEPPILRHIQAFLEPIT